MRFFLDPSYHFSTPGYHQSEHHQRPPIHPDPTPPFFPPVFLTLAFIPSPFNDFLCSSWLSLLVCSYVTSDCNWYIKTTNCPSIPLNSPFFWVPSLTPAPVIKKSQFKLARVKVKGFASLPHPPFLANLFSLAPSPDRTASSPLPLFSSLW